jgi:hypothetical protein
LNFFQGLGIDNGDNRIPAVTDVAIFAIGAEGGHDRSFTGQESFF